MAAYAQTTVIDLRTSERLHLSRLAILYGTIDVTNYNTTLAEITGITSRFRGTPRVMLGGISTLGFMGTWIAASKSVKCFYPSVAHQHDFVVGSGTIGTNMEIGLDLNTNAGKVEGAAGITAERTLSTNTPVASKAAGAATQVVADVNIGVFEFFAIGIGR